MTEAEWIQLVIDSIGGDTVDGILATNLPIYWGLHSDAATDAQRALLTKINGIDLLLGQSWRAVDYRALDGAVVNLSDMFDHLVKLRDLAQSQADAAVSGGSGGGIALGALTTTAPIMPGRGGVDPNARRYRGDPLERS